VPEHGGREPRLGRSSFEGAALPLADVHSGASLRDANPSASGCGSRPLAAMENPARRGGGAAPPSPSSAYKLRWPLPAAFPLRRSTSSKLRAVGAAWPSTDAAQCSARVWHAARQPQRSRGHRMRMPASSADAVPRVPQQPGTCAEHAVQAERFGCHRQRTRG